MSKGLAVAADRDDFVCIGIGQCGQFQCCLGEQFCDRPIELVQLEDGFIIQLLSLVKLLAYHIRPGLAVRRYQMWLGRVAVDQDGIDAVHACAGHQADIERGHSVSAEAVSANAS